MVSHRTCLPKSMAHAIAAAAFSFSFATSSSAQQETPSSPISEAEVLLFQTNHLKNVEPPQTLHYGFQKKGTMEKGFSDQVEVQVGPGKDNQTRTAAIKCMPSSQTGTQKLELPPVEAAEGNPALMCFLEREIREMQRLTSGKAPYFHRRIARALAENAQITPIKIKYDGKEVSGKEIRISPYLDDPNKAKFERLTGKYYVFKVSNDVPGGIYEIDAVTPDPNKGPNLMEEVLALSKVDGAQKKN